MVFISLLQQSAAGNTSHSWLESDQVTKEGILRDYSICRESKSELARNRRRGEGCSVLTTFCFQVPHRHPVGHCEERMLGWMGPLWPDPEGSFYVLTTLSPFQPCKSLYVTPTENGSQAGRRGLGQREGAGGTSGPKPAHLSLDSDTFTPAPCCACSPP